MRRKDRERDRGFALEVIDSCEYGVAAMTDQENGMPYCIPLSMVRDGEVLYFHCALEGRKLELLRRNSRVCVSFVGSNVASEDDFTTYFRSACVKGTAFEVLDEQEKIHALRVLSQRLTPGAMPGFEEEISRYLGVTGVWGIRMEEVTGKEKKRPGT